MPKKRSEHYVDNKLLYEEMKNYLDAVKEAEESDSEPPRIPEYIGECLLKISTRLLKDYRRTLMRTLTTRST